MFSVANKLFWLHLKVNIMDNNDEKVLKSLIRGIHIAINYVIAHRCNFDYFYISTSQVLHLKFHQSPSGVLKPHDAYNTYQELCVWLADCCVWLWSCITLQWRYNGRDIVSNHQLHHCLLNRSFRRRSKKKHQSSASLAFVRGIHRGPVNSPHEWPVTRKMFPSGDVITRSMV